MQALRLVRVTSQLLVLVTRTVTTATTQASHMPDTCGDRRQVIVSIETQTGPVHVAPAPPPHTPSSAPRP